MDSKRESIARSVTAYENGRFLTRQRELVDEVVWRIAVNNRDVGKLSCSPWELADAAAGYLYTNGYIGCAAEIKTITVAEDVGLISVETEEVPRKPELSGEPLTLCAEEVMVLAAALEDGSHLFHRTGGVHGAALADRSGLLVRCEDVSRHVAVDKVVGACLRQNITMQNRILVFSGRVPGEIIEKAEAMGCAMVIARSAPTDYACRQAEKAGITLIGFAREDGFNIYTCPERVIH